MKRRIIGLLIALCLVGTLFTACSQDAPSGNSGSASQSSSNGGEEYIATVKSKYADVTDAPTFKIGFTHTPPSDTLSAAYHRVLDYTAAEFGCEMMYGEIMSGDLSEWQAAYENLGQAGCDGEIIIYCTGATVEYFDSKGIYWASVCSEIIDQDIIQIACASDYYCGNICEVDEQAGYDMAQGMYDAGCRYIAYLAPTAGMNTCHDERVRGIERFLDDHPDVELATSWRGSPFATGVQEVLAAYPDIDGLMSTGGDTAIPAAIYAAGMEKTCKYACVDIQEGVYDQLKDGVCVWVAGGQYPTAQLGFALVYNGLTGHKIMPDLATTMHRPYMYIKSAEDYENYMKYMEGSIPAYTGDEIKDLCAVYNKEASDEKLGELLQSYCDNYTMEDLLKRHGDLNIE